ncbi:DUF402 domain-containing protein [Paenibacillus ferrarius]|uniref:DUF402 domain-containing protein n=1 Tax=Paenibacillus ferrarius TaxID=1469647 RepID=UPI003D275B1E
MQTLRKITDFDIQGGAYTLLNRVSRYAARGVLLDQDGNVAMMDMTRIGLLKLPGGGIEAGEDAREAFLREVQEETGCAAEIVHALGYIEEHKWRNSFMQHSACFIAKATAVGGPVSFTRQEAALGMQVTWLALTEARERLAEALRDVEDYSDRFMLMRDLTILDEAAQWLAGYGMTIPIRALKYGNRPHYDWETTLLERGDAHLFVLGHHGRQLRHYTKGKTFTIDRWTVEFFPLDAWFTVSADVVDGRIVQYYCNICEPPRLEQDGVSFIDLDLDLIYRDGVWQVVDEDEFAEHTVKFGYPPELVNRVWQELAKLQARIASRQFPFDGSMERLVSQAPHEV